MRCRVGLTLRRLVPLCFSDSSAGLPVARFDGFASPWGRGAFCSMDDRTFGFRPARGVNLNDALVSKYKSSVFNGRMPRLVSTDAR